MARPVIHHVAPEKAKTRSEPRLEAKFSSFVCAVAFSTPNPAKATKAIMKKLPVPGPNSPS